MTLRDQSYMHPDELGFYHTTAPLPPAPEPRAEVPPSGRVAAPHRGILPRGRPSSRHTTLTPERAAAIRRELERGTGNRG